MNTTKKRYVNHRERLGGLVFVLLFFCAGVVLALWLVFSDRDLSHIFARNDAVSIKTRRQQSFGKVQQESLHLCDLVTEMISGYDPDVNAIYSKNEIQYIINELRRHYVENENDKRYLVFLHMGDFYEMWFNDREHLWHLKANLDYLTGNLAECELGLEKRTRGAATTNH